MDAACARVAASRDRARRPSKRWRVRLRSAAPIRWCRTCSVRCSRLLGDRVAADAWHRRAVAARPDVAAFQLNHASNLIALGRDGDATASARCRARGRSGQRAGALDAGQLAHRHDRHSTSRGWKRCATSTPGGRTALAFVEYAIGKEYEDLEQWDDAFAAFARGAAAKRATVDYDEAADAAAFDAIVATFTSQWCAASRIGCDDASPIFVVGLPRTGTTLVERIISSHSQVHSAGEVQQFPFVGTAHDGRCRCAAPLRRRSSQPPPTSTRRRWASCISRSTTRVRGTLPRFVDKLPLNYLYVGLIAKALPNARIVHVTRNPIDSCFANYKQLFADAYFHSYDQREMARHYVRYRRLMQHWAAVLPGRFIDVAYEDVTADLEREARRSSRIWRCRGKTLALHFTETVRPSAPPAPFRCVNRCIGVPSIAGDATSRNCNRRSRC